MSGGAKIYVGNLSWNTNDELLGQCIVMKDRETGRSRGFGFVTFASEQEANAAIAGMNEQELDNRRLRVNLANSRPAGGAGGEGGYGGSSGYGGGGGGALTFPTTELFNANAVLQLQDTEANLEDTPAVVVCERASWTQLFASDTSAQLGYGQQSGGGYQGGGGTCSRD
ncbi:hypothetical protein QFC22_000130 [Naganishia vaughanmartiniae]|uniref:Uncharacterized protein n=1 Tax=Naganishia vaughanmartiniae TaxID=1424756 RepID=A0ACC2XP87_9TREE|nr:hypothetical protein QFC22_000130 [Naganishia vaughanmartiniae]